MVKKMLVRMANKIMMIVIKNFCGVKKVRLYIMERNMAQKAIRFPLYAILGMERKYMAVIRVE